MLCKWLYIFSNIPCKNSYIPLLPFDLYKNRGVVWYDLILWLDSRTLDDPWDRIPGNVLSLDLSVGLHLLHDVTCQPVTFISEIGMMMMMNFGNWPCWSANCTGLLILLLFLVMSSLMSSSFSTMSSLQTCLVLTLDVVSRRAVKYQTRKSGSKPLIPKDFLI